MPAQPCAKHPKVTTYVRCGRCDAPICVDCMVDTPVGKKCRACAQRRTHLEESTAGQVLRAFVITTAFAVPAGWLMYAVPIFYIMPFIYGGVVGEVALRAGKRSRSTAMQVATGLAALIGSVAGYAPEMLPFFRSGLPPAALMIGFGIPLAMAAVGTVIAVSRVRYL